MSDIAHMREFIDTADMVMIELFSACAAYIVLGLLLGIALWRKGNRL